MFPGNGCSFLLALDPGREKVGIAILRRDGSVVFQRVSPLGEVEEIIGELKKRYNLEEAVLGGGTGSAAVLPLLERMGFRVHRVDERGSSEEARRLYLKECRIRGWKRVVAFLSFLFSSRSFDDWQAVVIGRRFLGRTGKGHG
ncbi:MAG: hypothetical protein H5U36_01045 [Candidatus Caldatribacterium sp.]|nr:hypothetical protein [Candidatus Caldatribacterium sp.]